MSGEEDTSFDPDELDRQLRKARLRERVKWARRKERITKSFRDLIRELGGKCVKCGSALSPSIQHVEPRKYDVAQLSWPKRVKTYWEEYRAGVPLTVLCLPCNSSDGATRVKKLRGMLRRKRRSRR